MELKAPNPFSLLENRDALPLIQVYFEINHLKQLYRQGWLKRGVSRERCESVAEHTFGVAVLAFLLADGLFPELDSSKVTRMALLHDFGEVYAGDIIPGDAVTPEQKQRLEREAVGQILGRLAGGEAYLALWEEFEAGESPEARFVRQIDRLEMALQAGVYEFQGETRLSEFFDSARSAISDERLVEILMALSKIRSGNRF